MKTTINYGLKKPDGTDVVNIDDLNYNADILDTKLKEVDNKVNNIKVPVTSVNGKTGAVLLSTNDIKANDSKTIQQKFDENASQLAETTTILTATGTANAITLNVTLQDKKKYSFKAIANSTGAVTINGKPLKKSDGTQIGSGGIKSGKVYDFYYDATANSVFNLAKADGNATVADVLAGKTFSNGDEAGLTGTMTNRPSVNQATKVIALTNLMKNGNFEHGIDGWSFSTSNTCYLSTTGGIFGDKFLYMHGLTTNVETLAYSPINIPYIQGHKYYASCYMLTGTGGYSTQIYFPNLPPYPNTQVILPSSNIWHQISFISADTSIPSGTYNIRLDLDNNKADVTMCFDGVTIIDLTASFGAGKEPTKAQMDTILKSLGGYFDGTAVLESIPNGGYVTNGSTGSPEVVTACTDLIPSNILSGKNVMGVNGGIPIRGSEEYPTWRRAIVDAMQPMQGRAHLSIPLGAYITPNPQQNNNMGIFVDDVNFISSNILQGKSIFGLVGTLVQGKKFASGTVSSTDYGSVRGLNFRPSYVIMANKSGDGYANMSYWVGYFNGKKPPTFNQPHIDSIFDDGFSFYGRWDCSNFDWIAIE